MAIVIEKVTAFVTRTANGRRELLLFQHPYAGTQIPAGTVEPGEAPEAAAIRETQEETGLRNVAIDQYLGVHKVVLPDTQRMIVQPTGVYARPDLMSFNWIRLRRGLTVTVERTNGNFTQISYQEWDRQADPSYISYQITGWVPSEVLMQSHRRHFFSLTTTDTTPERSIRLSRCCASRSSAHRSKPCQRSGRHRLTGFACSCRPPDAVYARQRLTTIT